MTAVRVSIGLPVRNGGRHLAETLDSLLGQSFANFELIISDNASTDDTEAICRRYEKRDRRIRYVRHAQDLGLTKNFNGVFQLASAAYFKWATADDLCDRRYLASCVDTLDCNPSAVLAYPKTKFIDDKGCTQDINDPGWDLRSDDVFERLRYIIYAGHWNNAVLGMMRTSALLKTRLLASYPLADRRLLGELAIQGKILEIPEYLFFRRLHGSASSQNTGNLEWLVRYYRGSGGGFCLPFLNLNFDHVTTILGSDLRPRQKLALFNCVLRCVRWGRKDVVAEVKLACRSWVRSVFGGVRRGAA